MKRTLLFALCVFAATAEKARLSTEKYGTECPSGLAGQNCQMAGNEEPAASDHQYTFLTTLNYKTQMLPKSSAPPDTDNLPGTTVSAATGNRFIKTTSTLIETGTVVYEGCGVRYEVSDLQKYAGFVAVASDSSRTNHVDEMITFLSDFGQDYNTASLSSHFVEEGTCSNNGYTTRGSCVGNNEAWTPTAYKCEFYVQNNMYLGAAKIAVAFQKTSTTTATGDSRLTKLHAQVKFVPGADDPNFKQAADKGFIPQSFQNQYMRDLSLAYHDSCFSKAGYLRNDKSTQGECLDFNANFGVTTKDNDEQKEVPSSSIGGTITLRLTGTFLDQRYKVVSQSGVETLPSSIGDILLIKEGLELHADYRSFNDPTKDTRRNGGDGTVTFNPVNFRLRKRASSTLLHKTQLEGGETPTEKDFSNAGQPLDASDSPQLQNYYAGVANMGGISLDSSTAQADLRCETADADGNLYDINTDLATRGACHAQYVLNHEFVFKYGDLPHFKPGYIGCDICESVIAVKAFHEDCDGTMKYQVNTQLAVSVKDLPTSPNTITSKAVNLKGKQAQFTFGPNFFYKMGNMFDVVPSTHNIIKKSGGGPPTSLDDEINMFNTDGGFLSFESAKPNGDTSGLTQISLETGTDGACPTLTNLRLRDLGTDTRAAVEHLLISDCRIDVPNNFYGTNYKIHFQNTEADNEQNTVVIRETDDRNIMIGDASLNLINRVEADILRVATTITMSIQKTLPQGSIPTGYANAGSELADLPITFRLRGDKGDFAGFVSTTNGGAECAGDKIYWKSTSAALRTYRLPSTLAGSHASYTTELVDSVSQAMTRPLGICIGSSGLTPAPMETMPAGPVTDAGKLLEYVDCKAAEGTWKLVSEPDVELTCTQEGDTLEAEECTLSGNAADEIGVHLACTKAAIQEEVLFTSDGQNGQVKEHTITSTDQCTGKIDLQLEDQTQYQEFAIYRTRIECSRVSTQELSDHVRLKYEYETKLDLEDNSLEIDALYSPDVNTKGVCNDDQYPDQAACTGAGNTWTPTYTVSSSFGTCDNTNNFVTVSGCSNVQFENDPGNNKLVLRTDEEPSKTVTTGLEQLLSCSDSGNPTQVIMNGGTTPRNLPNDPVARNNIASYVITYDLATIYQRTLHNPAFSSNPTIKYCDDQQFTATVRRDAKASTTVAQIKAAQLNRAVAVMDIGWVGNAEGNYLGSDCENPNEYQLEVIMKSMDQDARGDGGTWRASELTKAFIDTASDADNSNNMRIHKPDSASYGILEQIDTVAPQTNGGSGIETAGHVHGNYFKIRSACVVVSECIPDADGVVDGDSWGDLTSEFKTDLVIRGTFLRSDVDSKIELTLDFDECPLDGEAEIDGEIRVGLQLKCNLDQATEQEKLLAKSLAQTLTNTHDRENTVTSEQYTQADGSIDCSQAFADDVARVSGFVFATKSGCTDAQSNPNILDAERATDGSEDYDAECALLKDKHDQAVGQGWSADIVDVYIDRFDTSGSTPLLTSSTRICKCESGAVDCDIDQTGIIGLEDFVQFTEAQTEFAHYQACGRHGLEENQAPSLHTDSTAAVGGDKMIHQFGVMPLSQATADLFKVRYEVIMVNSNARRRLRTTQDLHLGSGAAGDTASTTGLKVLQLTSDVAEQSDVADDVAEPSGLHNHTNAGHEDEGKHDHDMSPGAIAGIVLGSVSVVAIGVLLATQASKGKSSEGGSESEEAPMMEDEEPSDGYRQQRFRNLRY